MAAVLFELPAGGLGDWHMSIEALQGVAFSETVPLDFLESLAPGRSAGEENPHCINGFEAYWVLRASEHWHERLQGKLVFIFCDNQTAVRGLIKGYSGSRAVCKIVGCVWRAWIAAQSSVWVEWVHTRSNIADPLSREGWWLAAQQMNLTLQSVEWSSPSLSHQQLAPAL